MAAKTKWEMDMGNVDDQIMVDVARRTVALACATYFLRDLGVPSSNDLFNLAEEMENYLREGKNGTDAKDDAVAKRLKEREEEEKNTKTKGRWVSSKGELEGGK